FSVGSSGVEQALADFWQQEAVLGKEPDWEIVDQVNPLLILCGSVSPITAGQIDYALENGFAEVAIDPNFLKERLQDAVNHYTEQVLKYIQLGKSVVVHTARGPKDPRRTEMNVITQKLGWNVIESKSELPKRFGELLGETAKAVVQKHPIKRLIIAGGDTSSYTARALGIHAVKMIAPQIKGAPLCRVYAKDSPVDGIQINLKGGQLGEKDYFVALQNGSLNKNNKQQ